MTRSTGHNRRLAKKRVQWLNEALCFVSSLVLADSFVLRNPLLRQAPKRCGETPLRSVSPHRLGGFHPQDGSAKLRTSCGLAKFPKMSKLIWETSPIRRAVS